MHNTNIKFLKDKYNLHNDEWVHNTVHRSNILYGANISTSNIKESIWNFLERFNQVIKNKDINPQSFEALKKLIFQENIIKPENIPNSYWEFQKRVIINQWRWWELRNWEIPEQAKKSEIERILKEQKTSLWSWINYLSNPTCPYDISMKYFILRNIITVDSDFWKRSNSTVNNFPELNQEHLARTMDLIQKSINGEKIELENKNLEKFAKNKNFVKIYEFFINEAKIDNNILENTKWEWKKYDQKSDHIPLVKSLEWKNTGWCTVWEDTAKKQLSAWDFYVYYSQDKDGNNTLPRVAIRMEWKQIAEIRWILPDQEMDTYILPVLSKKLEEFWGAAKEYKEKERDMFFLTAITEKLNNEEKLTEEEMRFLFEVDKNIKNFWYGKDPRIEENKAKIKNEDLINFINKNATEEKIVKLYDLVESLPENVKFPKNIWWNLWLYWVTSLPENITFPQSISWYLDLSRLTSLPENITFPKNIWWNLYLFRLTILPENITFPESIWWNLDLRWLTSLPENIAFPKNIWWSLYLHWLTSLPENITFPKNIWWNLYLSWLTSLPENIDFLIKLNWKLILNSSLEEEFEKKSKAKKYSSKFKIKNFFKTLFKK